MQQQLTQYNSNPITKVIGSYKYTTSNLLGKGSFGEVYLCQHLETQEEFALKVIPRLKVENTEDFNKEIEIMKRLSGPNIVKLHKVLGSANNFYQVIDLCDTDLYKIKKKQNRFSEQEAIKIMTDVLGGFLELIENGIIHRDVKPANILVKNGVYKLADFGFSRIVDDLTSQKFATIIGTPMYMSPQLLENQQYTTKSDIWSFGFIFYELLQGRTPWVGTSILELIKNIREKDLTFCDHIPVSNLVINVIQRCLEKEEENRISWLELFQHPIFISSFKQIQNLEIRCNQLVKFIATNLRLQIARQNISVEDLVMQNKLKTQLSPVELEFLFKLIDNKLTKLEILQIFNSIVSKDKDYITIDELKQWLEMNSIQYQSNYAKKKQNQCLHDLKAIMKKHNSTLKQYYDKFNKNKDGKLKYSEFQIIILRNNEHQTEQQIFESFNFIDKNENGFLTIEDFQYALDNLPN